MVGGSVTLRLAARRRGGVVISGTVSYAETLSVG